jgi:hypothetical protein
MYRDMLPIYKRLEQAVHQLVNGKKESRWHYEGRLKEEESFALKMETGGWTR